MRIPAVTRCDVCEQEIPEDTIPVAIQAPVAPDVARDVRAQWERDIRESPMAQAGLIGPHFPMPVPTHYQVEICVGCLTARFPELDAVVALRVSVLLEKRRKQAARDPFALRKEE